MNRSALLRLIVASQKSIFPTLIKKLQEQSMVLTKPIEVPHTLKLPMGSHFAPAPSSTSGPVDTSSSGAGHRQASDVLTLLWKANSFLMQGLRTREGYACTPLILGNCQIGLLTPCVVSILRKYSKVFTVAHSGVFINPQLNTYDSRTSAVNAVLRDIRDTQETVALRSWREENFVVWGHYGGDPLFEMERAAVAMLGIRSYGIQINGYVRASDGSLEGMWLQKRADNKPTYPGMLDNMAGGGITAGLTASEAVAKEAAEEASIPEHIIKRVKSAGTISLFTETERGIHANTEHVYDLELPSGFSPNNSDGEVQGFIFIKAKNLLEYALDTNYKLTSAPVLLDFLVRHGIINSNTVSDLPEVVEMLHAPLHMYYRMMPFFPNSSYSDANTGVSALSYMLPGLRLESSTEKVGSPDSGITNVSTNCEEWGQHEDSDVRLESEDDIYY